MATRYACTLTLLSYGNDCYYGRVLQRNSNAKESKERPCANYLIEEFKTNMSHSSTYHDSQQMPSTAVIVDAISLSPYLHSSPFKSYWTYHHYLTCHTQLWPTVFPLLQSRRPSSKRFLAWFVRHPCSG